jgi:hypothetical protein
LFAVLGRERKGEGKGDWADRYRMGLRDTVSKVEEQQIEQTVAAGEKVKL